MPDDTRTWLLWSAIWSGVAFAIAIVGANDAAGLVALGLSWVCVGYAGEGGDVGY